jgi:hypothetical protein
MIVQHTLGAGIQDFTQMSGHANLLCPFIRSHISKFLFKVELRSSGFEHETEEYNKGKN